MIPTPKHFNHNLPVSVAMEFTGPLVGFHDVHRLAIIPLDNFFEPAKGVIPFVVTFKPIHEDAPYISRETYAHAKATGIHPVMASDVMKLWAERLPKKKNKRLVPISYNWTLTSSFIKELIGPDVFDDIFFDVPRDLTATAAYISDTCNVTFEEVPFPKSGFISMANRSTVTVDEPHDALNLAKATAKVYQSMLKRMYNNMIL